jgi:hypothetical protein
VPQRTKDARWILIVRGVRDPATSGYRETLKGALAWNFSCAMLLFNARTGGYFPANDLLAFAMSVPRQPIFRNLPDRASNKSNDGVEDVCFRYNEQ